MDVMYANALDNSPFYTQVSSYMVWRAHPPWGGEGGLVTMKYINAHIMQYAFYNLKMNIQYSKLIYDFKFEKLHKIMSFIAPHFILERWFTPPPFACLTHNDYETWLYSPIPFATTTIQSRYLILMPSHCGHNKVFIDLLSSISKHIFGVG